MKTVTLTCVLAIACCALMSACKKKSNPQPANLSATRLWEIYKDTIPGTYTWAHYTNPGYVGQPSNLTRMADTTFAITLQDPKTLMIHGHSLMYSDSIYYSYPGYGTPVDTAVTIHYFDIAFLLPSHNACNFFFDRTNDSATFEIRTNGIGVRNEHIYKAKL